MMQEVSDEIVVTQAGEAAIADQLQDAAQTNVTQGSHLNYSLLMQFDTDLFTCLNRCSYLTYSRV